MYHYTTMPADQPPVENLTPPLETIATVLEDFNAVDSLASRTDRYPPSLTVSLTVTDLDDAPGVTDVIDTYDARIRRPRLSTDDSGSLRLEVDLEVPRPFIQDGTPKLRKQGNTRVASLPKDAVARSGFTLGDELSVLAREGEIRLVRSDQWPDEEEVLPEEDLLPAGFYKK